MNAKQMALPEPHNTAWDFLIALVPWTALYGFLHTCVFYVFKYWTESRDAKIDDAVDKRFKIQVKPLEDKIQNLTDLFIQHFDVKK